MVLLCQWLCHLCGELWYYTRAEGFTYVSFTHTHTEADRPHISMESHIDHMIADIAGQP
jgi:hypothetical protein